MNPEMSSGETHKSENGERRATGRAGGLMRGWAWPWWLLALAVCLSSSLAAGTDGELRRIRVGGADLQVRMAISPTSRGRGLAGVRQLPDDRGMLFRFEYPQRVRFWMKGVDISLAIGFFSAEGVLTEVVEMPPDGGATIHQASSPTLWALEVNQGWFHRNGVGVGAELELPAD